VLSARRETLLHETRRLSPSAQLGALKEGQDRATEEREIGGSERRCVNETGLLRNPRDGVGVSIAFADDDRRLFYKGTGLCALIEWTGPVSLHLALAVVLDISCRTLHPAQLSVSVPPPFSPCPNRVRVQAF